MKTVLAITGVVLALSGVALSAYLKWTNVDMTALRLFLTYPVASLSASLMIGVGGAFLRIAARD